MATPKWQAGKLYPPGSIVQPRTALPNVPVVLNNPGFEDGTLTGWDLTNTPAIGNWAVPSRHSYSGARSALVNTDQGDPLVEFVLLNTSQPACAPGTLITCNGAVRLSEQGYSAASVMIVWYDGADNEIGDPVIGNVYKRGQDGLETWFIATASALAPAGTASVRIGFWGECSDDGDCQFDALSWNYDSAAPQQGLIYKAVQDAAGLSDSTEPVWPGILGQQVVDNEVIWEAVSISRIVWQARATLISGETEPTWPTDVGDRVADGSIAWEAVSRRVDDPNAPHSPYVVINEGKVYAGDDDIIAYSAANMPLDWTSPENAGYLPFGLNKYGSNPIKVVGLYRGNLVAFNSQGFQLWQIDPDPALNHLLDSLPIGSTHHWAYSPVANDAFLLSALGVRTIGVTANSTNLRAGDVGSAVDPLVQLEMRLATEEPKSLYIPSAGQYWLIFNDPNPATDACEVYVHTISQSGGVGAWSRYLFPHRIDAHAIEGDVLLLRSGDMILEYSEDYTADLIPTEGGDGTEFDSVIWWPYSEVGGQLGQDKTTEALDIVGFGNHHGGPLFEIGWNQTDFTQFTPPYRLPADTVPEASIPFELTAPSMSVRLTYTGAGWQFTALNLYLQGRALAR